MIINQNDVRLWGMGKRRVCGCGEHQLTSTMDHIGLLESLTKQLSLMFVINMRMMNSKNNARIKKKILYSAATERVRFHSNMLYLVIGSAKCKTYGTQIVFLLLKEKHDSIFIIHYL